MNRKSFLKTIGVGIAGAVITPKIVLNEFAKSEKEITAKCLTFNQEHVFTEYGHFEEDIHIVEIKVCLWDMAINKDEVAYVVTYLDQNNIGLTSVLAETNPNELMVDKEHFGEYFFIISHAFNERKL